MEKAKKAEEQNIDAELEFEIAHDKSKSGSGAQEKE